MNSTRPSTDWRLFVAAVLLVLAADLVTKHLVVAGHWRAEYLWGLLRIVRVDNPGAAFGLFAGARGAFVAIKLAALVVILALLGRGQESRLTLPLALVFGGALGNLMDRLRGTGEVIDFIDLTVAGRHWYVFNIADASISIGAVLIVLTLLRGERRPAATNAPGDA
ncbi:MAG: signal peptidase II [Candidatus Krumholzibacteriia bacterium]|nr:signal peptidase II [bacterium]MCB9513151.1 signal peptidase II [Candidatus Latescibacterota bacterium]MCB9514615.1 signal peptidase II [Candidatus Latescibacterota bacterium]